MTPFISRKADPFIVKHMYPYGVFDIKNPKNDNVFMVNVDHFKVYFDNFCSENESIVLNNPDYKDCFLSHIAFVFLFCVTFFC